MLIKHIKQYARGDLPVLFNAKQRVHMQDESPYTVYRYVEIAVVEDKQKMDYLSDYVTFADEKDIYPKYFKDIEASGSYEGSIEDALSLEIVENVLPVPDHLHSREEIITVNKAISDYGPVNFMKCLATLDDHNGLETLITELGIHYGK